MNINAIPILGWILSFIAYTSLAVPFWICWTVCKIGSKYFYWVDPVFISIPFWDCVGLFMVLSIIRSIFLPRPLQLKEVKDAYDKSQKKS